MTSGNSRELGPANLIAEEAQHSADTLEGLVTAVSDKRAVVAIRAANALRKVQKVQPQLVNQHAGRLLRAASKCTDVRTRWNLVTIIGEMPLQGRDKDLAVELLFEALGSQSRLLRTFALTGLVNFARGMTS